MEIILNYNRRKAVINPTIDSCNSAYSLYKKNPNIKVHSSFCKKGQGNFKRILSVFRFICHVMKGKPAVAMPGRSYPLRSTKTISRHKYS